LICQKKAVGGRQLELKGLRCCRHYVLIQWGEVNPLGKLNTDAKMLLFRAGTFAAGGACRLCSTMWQSASTAAIPSHFPRLRVGILQSAGRSESGEPHSFLFHWTTTTASTAGFLPWRNV